MQKSSVGGQIPLRRSRSRTRSASTTSYQNPTKKGSLTDINKSMAALGLNYDGGASPRTGFDKTNTGDYKTSSSEISVRNKPSARDEGMPLPYQPSDKGTSHLFLVIAADSSLVDYSRTVLSNVIRMPDIPEITSLKDSRCIWPHTVHLTIYGFGKILNIDIPSIIDYSKKNIEVIDPFHLNISGMFHHERLHTVGYEVQKETVEPLRQIKTNMSKWFNKGLNWESFLPIMSLLKIRAPFGSKHSYAPISNRSIRTIIKRFGGVQHMQEVIPSRDIQLCLAGSSTETTFYENLL